MDFALTETQRIFESSVRKFAENELKKGALSRAHSLEYPWDVAKLMAEQGLFGITIPERDGGQGGTLLDAVLAIEQVALACPRSADLIQAGNFGAIRVLAEFGSEAQKRRYLSQLLKGQILIAVAMTEPEAGSAVTELKTSAVADGSGFRVKGSKIFTTHSVHANVFLVYVRFGEGLEGIGSVFVERGTDGVTFGPASNFMSGEQWSELHFNDAYVPSENVLFGSGGFKKQIAAFNVERLGNSARSLALARYAYLAARSYALHRKQFGRPLCEFQGIQWKFASMKMELDAAQLLLYRAAANADRGLPSAEETAIAKAYCNKAGFNIASEALQVMGAMGYTQDLLVEYCFRRTRGWMIAGGAVEIMMNRISEHVFGRRFSQRASQE
jgi:alkylation response protein AidB-like acyl-CoA dehydrogenase